jgi:hypothetical protein
MARSCSPISPILHARCAPINDRILTSLAPNSAEVTTVRGHGCDLLVIAASPQTGFLNAVVGAEVPLAPARVEMIVTEPLPSSSEPCPASVLRVSRRRPRDHGAGDRGALQLCR